VNSLSVGEGHLAHLLQEEIWKKKKSPAGVLCSVIFGQKIDLWISIEDVQVPLETPLTPKSPCSQVLAFFISILLDILADSVYISQFDNELKIYLHASTLI